jgi:hypothetical protein
MLINRVKFSELMAAVAELGYNVSTSEEGVELFASAVPFLYQLFKAENKEALSEAVTSALEVEDYSGIISLLAKEGYTKKEAEDICNFYEDFEKYTCYDFEDFYSHGFTKGIREAVQILVGIRTTFDIRLWGGLILVTLLEYDYVEN